MATPATNLTHLSRLVSITVFALSALIGVFALPGCDEKVSSDVATVKVKGKTFHLEIAADDDKRFLGLGKRKSIDDDGGMVFVFPEAQVRDFVMRDCECDIDIIYLDGAGRILSMHAMKFEDPRGADEQPDKDGFNEKYDARLKKYSSRYPSQIVVELKGGKIKELGLTETDKITLDADGLKKLAR